MITKPRPRFRRCSPCSFSRASSSAHLGAPEIPEDEESNWYYVVYSAANPFSQMPRDKRGPIVGGVGSAMNKHHELLASIYGKGTFPIYRHAENPISYLALLRSGYEDVYAKKDAFDVPDLG